MGKWILLLLATLTSSFANTITGKLDARYADVDVILVNLQTSRTVQAKRFKNRSSFTLKNIRSGQYGLIVRAYLDPINLLDHIESTISPLDVIPNNTLELVGIQLDYPQDITLLSQIADSYRNISQDTLPYLQNIDPEPYEIPNTNDITPSQFDDPNDLYREAPNRTGTTPYDWY